MKITTRNSLLTRVLLGAGALSWLSPVRAQSGFASCVSGWEWSYNSGGQNPCEIAGSLQAPCLGYSVYTLGPIGSGSNYVTPQQNDTSAQKCGCNTIIYSLYQACTLCQFSTNNTALTWAFWAQFCDQVYVTQYPLNIPFNASVPHWAYLNDTNPGFDPVLAQAAGRDPEATPSSPPTVSISSSTTPRVPSTVPNQSTVNTKVTLSPSSTTSTSTSGGGDGGGSNGDGSSGDGSSGGGNKTNTGAIAGGVVGGIVGVVGLGALAFFFLKRRAGGNPDNLVGVDKVAFNPAAGDQFYEPPRLYNPADPSTFPTPVSAGDSSNSGGYTTNSFQDGRYQGAAEL